MRKRGSSTHTKGVMASHAADRDRADGFVDGYKVDNFTVGMERAGTGLVDIDGDGVYDMQYGMKISVVAGQTTKPGGADGSKSMETPRPDGPQPTEQQINEGPVHRAARGRMEDEAAAARVRG